MVGPCPRDDLLRTVDDGVVVENEGGHPAVARELLHLAPAGGVVEKVGQEPEPVGVDHLGVVARVAQRAVGVAARVSARAHGGKGSPADVELHDTVSVASMPAARCAGTVQYKVYVPGLRLIVSACEPPA